MNYENFTTGYNKPTIITAQQYGTKVSVEIDHSDTDIDELFDAFETLITGLGYHNSAWKQWILDRAEEYNETDAEELKEKSNEWEAAFHKETNSLIKSKLKERAHWNWDGEDYEGQFEDWENETPEEFKPNNVLTDAKKQYDEQVKMDAKKTKTKKSKK